ncbi:hypothetical protein SDC9_101875 [bioreactor metagenome]|uniref:Uncharacterized protein n=1 Tax=bioreactor metagenome TaxID=1076179 RepID=A0A645APS2_9ZZZZ
MSRGIPVIYGRYDLFAYFWRRELTKFSKSIELVIFKRLGREEEQGSGGIILYHLLQNGEHVAETFTACCTGADHYMLAVMNTFNGLSLM